MFNLLTRKPYSVVDFIVSSNLLILADELPSLLHCTTTYLYVPDVIVMGISIISIFIDIVFLL